MQAITVSLNYTLAGLVSITLAKLGFLENGCIMMDSKKSNAQEVACLNSTQPNSERHHIAFMFNFEVLNLEVDCKKAEQKLLELFFKLDHDQLTLILLSHLFWRFQSTFKL